MRKPERKDLIQARKVSNMFQFINDLTAISDGCEFDKIYPDIYPLYS